VSRLAYVIFGVGAFVLIATAGMFSLGADRKTIDGPQDRPVYANGKQILLVYVGSEDCKASLRPGFARTISAIREVVQAQARVNREPFSTLGVSAGSSPAGGVRYLARFGQFDEISSGHGWLNDEAMHFVWQTLPGEALVPQIVVIERQLAVLQPGYGFSNERVLVRVLGVPQIENWLADGAPVR
jgi:hypothetical protein